MLLEMIYLSYLLEKVIKLGSKFHSSRPSTNDDKVQKPSSLLLRYVWLCCQFKVGQNLVSDVPCISYLLTMLCACVCFGICVK